MYILTNNGKVIQGIDDYILAIVLSWPGMRPLYSILNRGQILMPTACFVCSTWVFIEKLALLFLNGLK